MRNLHQSLSLASKGAVIASLLFISTVIPGTALADNAPNGQITMTVQDLTNGGPLTQSTSYVFAPQVQAGDEIQFQILLQNQGAVQSLDAMATTVVTNQLPSGMNLVSEDNMNVGTMDAKTSVYLNITATVTQTSPGLMQDQACFTGTAIDGSNPQSGCAIAVIDNTGGTSPSPSVPAQPVQSTPSTGGGSGGGTGTPLPNTGASSVLPDAFGAAAVITAGIFYIRARRRKIQS